MGTDSVLHIDELNVNGSMNGFVVRNGSVASLKGNESNTNPVQKNGSNLPQGGSNNDTYWLDLPRDGSSEDRVKKGSLQDASAYFHVIPISNGVFTDIAICVRTSNIQYYFDNKQLVYALLHGHASYTKPGCVLLGSVEVDIGVLNDTANRG
ncbi:hypothetical protein L2E82_41218 [Cichorium intybus]|uniref:Uncharacterized protein n=1 Tax=Cichorium intybus TaxID=13427 RepID=A0ACB9AND3_CICIN|nr:hypothetical protein L2E82_41218 [Cichorium intybus]